ncbi:MAG: metallophosphoesterase family protein [Candidatus Korobacteraceae bacterium]
MKIVVISDIHANLEALMALPEWGDELWVLGDLVDYGPNPRQVVTLLRSRAEIVMRGNHDQAVGFEEDPRCTPRYRKMAIETRDFTIRSMNGDLTRYLQQLPLHRTVERDGRKFCLCHAIPSDPLYGYCPENSDRWAQEIEEVDADYLLVGHTHTPFIRQVGPTTVVNPGSLGQAKTGKSDACYAAWYDDHFKLKQFAYPLHETVRKLEQMPVSQEVKRDLETVLVSGFLP